MPGSRSRRRHSLSDARLRGPHVNMGFRFTSIANDVRLFARVVAETAKATAAAIEEARSARPMP